MIALKLTVIMAYGSRSCSFWELCSQNLTSAGKISDFNITIVGLQDNLCTLYDWNEKIYIVKWRLFLIL